MPEQETVGDSGAAVISETTDSAVDSQILSEGEPTAAKDGVKPDSDAEKLNQRLEHLTESMRKLQSEKDKALSKIEQMEKKQEELSTATLSKTDKEQYQKQREALIEKINQGFDGETAVGLFEKLLYDAEQGAAKMVEPKVKALEAELANLKNELKSAHPDRIRYAGRIAELKAELPEVDEETLFKIAKREGSKGKRYMSVAPGTTATQAGSDMGSDAKLSEGQIATIKQMYPNATDKELETVAKNLAKKRGRK